MNSAWVTLAASFVILALDRAVSSSFSILMLPLEAELSVSRATVTLIFTAHMLTYSAASVFSGLVIARVGPRATIVFGGLLLGAGLACMAASHTLVNLILSFGLLCGGGIALVGLPANFVILSDRFPGRVATAMGIAGAGLGVGVLLVIPAMQWGVDRLGWRPVFLWTGIATAVTVTLCAWVQRMTPRTALGDGDVPRGNAGKFANQDASRDPAGKEGTGSTLARMARVARTRNLQGMALANILMGSALFGALTHQVALLSEIGWTALAAATALGTINVLRSASGPLWGFVVDGFGRRLGYGMSTMLAVVGILTLLLAQHGVLPANAGILIFIAAFGIGSAGTLPTNASLGSELFAPEDRGIFWGLIETAYAGGAAFGSWLVGWLFDLNGNYTLALALTGLQYVGSFVLVLLLSPRQSSRSIAT